MRRDDQYIKDSERLAILISYYTGISYSRLEKFLTENHVRKLLPCASQICKTDTQREKLGSLFEFKNLFETMKNTEEDRVYKIKSTSDAKAYFIDYFSDMSDRERMAAAFLDTQNQIISTKIVSTGTVNESMIFRREIIKEALFTNARSIMLAHNHPGGGLTPSSADIYATQKIKEGIESADMVLLDHIIVAGDTAFSMGNEGYISQDANPADIQKVASQIGEKNYTDDDWESDDESEDDILENEDGTWEYGEDEDEDDMEM